LYLVVPSIVPTLFFLAIYLPTIPYPASAD
jgi:hypothetical protein